MSITPKSSMEPSYKVSKHIDRIKREEDEDQWISGEELYTEGSSDEDDRSKSRDGSARRVKREHRGARPKVQRHIGKLEMSLSPAPKPPIVDLPPVERDSDSADDMPPVDISWKPKRGSIRLPHHTTDSHDALQRHNQFSSSTSEVLKE